MIELRQIPVDPTAKLFTRDVAPDHAQTPTPSVQNQNPWTDPDRYQLMPAAEPRHREVGDLGDVGSWNSDPQRVDWLNEGAKLDDATRAMMLVEAINSKRYENGVG